MAGGDQVDGVGSALRVWGVEDGDGGGEPGWGQPLPDGRVGHGTLLCQKGERVATAAAVPARAGGAPGRANGSGDRMHAPHGMNACAAPNVKCGKPWGDREGLAAARRWIGATPAPGCRCSAGGFVVRAVASRMPPMVVSGPRLIAGGALRVEFALALP